MTEHFLCLYNTKFKHCKDAKIDYLSFRKEILKTKH